MRLLTRRGGEFQLTDDLFDHEVPPYAILSHTWGHRNEEVSFGDMVAGTARQRPGYRKIKFCYEQAAKDGLQYFWVDTCCIDQRSSESLSESINSMYRWYQQAEKCYVYLADVSVADPYIPRFWEPAFRSSRWFSRGWTLQELLAPRIVLFFSREGHLFGDKKTLEALVHDITGIDVAALRGRPLAHFPIEERYRWARHRQTLRPEDNAYCLLGLFGIFIPIIYGEGRDSATSRVEREVLEAQSMSQKAAGPRWFGKKHLHASRQ